MHISYQEAVLPSLRPQISARGAAAASIDSPLAADEILRIDDLQTHFGQGPDAARAVDGVSLRVRKGRTVAVVGESGSGKSVTSLSVMRLLAPPGRIHGGSIWYRTRDGQALDLARLREAEMRKVRGREISMIFQDPMTSLNPLFTIGDQIAEMILLHEPISRTDALARARRMLELVEIPDAGRRMREYPHQMSGGMRQRVMIALALACNPSLLIADEPTTALDVTIQAQVLDLLRRLQADIGLSVLFITHNLGVVAEVAHEVVVMYAGNVVEQGRVEDIFDRPRHPYTLGLMSCVPNVERDMTGTGGRLRLKPIPGMVPSSRALPPGCSYAPRCSHAAAICTQGSKPDLVDVGGDHLSRCWKHEQL